MLNLYCFYHNGHGLQAIEVAQLMDEALDGNNVELVLRCIKIADSRISSSSMKTMESTTSELVATFYSSFSASWVYSKVVLLGVSFLERERRYYCDYRNCFFLYSYMRNLISVPKSIF